MKVLIRIVIVFVTLAAIPRMAAAQNVGGAAMMKAFTWLYQYAENRESQGDCAHYVRKSLSAAGYNQCEMALGLYASDYAEPLTERGFVNRIADYPTPYWAPVGAVLVYRGICPGTEYNRAGHVEIKTPRGYYSDYASEFARSATAAQGNNTAIGRCRELTGVWLPPKKPYYKGCNRPPDK